MAVTSFCGISIANLPDEGFANVAGFREWCRARGEGVTGPQLSTEDVSNQRLRDLFALLDLNCDQSVSKSERQNALESLYYTLARNGRGSDFDIGDINNLSSDLISLTKRTFMGAAVYKLFNASRGEVGENNYYKLTKDEFVEAVNAIAPGDQSKLWFDSISVKGVHIAAADVASMVFGFLDSASSVTTESAGTLSIHELSLIYDNILSKFNQSTEDLPQGLRPAVKVQNTLNEIKLFGGSGDVWQSTRETGVSQDSVRNAIAMAYTPVLTSFFRQFVDSMEAAGEDMRRAIDGKN